MSTPAYAIYLPLHPKSSALGEFLQAGKALAVEEKDTLQWFAMKFKSADTYAIFDTFPSTEARTAHKEGKIPEALLANADTLISQAPDFASAPATVLASKVPSDLDTSAITVGLFVKIKAEKTEELKQLLVGAVPLVEAEPLTALWYAVEFDGYFAVADFFASEEGQTAHLGGKVAAALISRGYDLDITEMEIIAAK